MKFKRIYIEISNVCNLNCPFCIKSTRERKIMSLEDFTSYATQARKYSEYIYLHVLGEPLLHPDFPAILRVCSKLGFKVNITTNATLLAEKKNIILNTDCVRQVNISLHGYNPQTHGELKKWLDGLVDFAKDFSERGGYTVFRFWTMGKNNEVYENDLKSMQLLSSLTESNINIYENRLSRSITLRDKIFVSFDKEFKWPSINDEIISENGRCHGARDMIAILADGTVVPCCLDGDGACSLGNLKESTLSEIIASNRFQNMKNGFLNGKLTEELCKKCSYRLRFNRV